MLNFVPRWDRKGEVCSEVLFYRVAIFPLYQRTFFLLSLKSRASAEEFAFLWAPEGLQTRLFILCCHWISLSLLLFQRQKCHGDLGLFAYHGPLGPCRFPCARVVSLFLIWSCAFCSTIFGFLLHGCEAAWDGSAYILWLNYCSAAGCIPLPFLWITKGASVKGNKWIFFVLGNSDLYLLDYKSDSKYLFSVFSWLVHLLSYFFSFSLILQERRKIFKENIFLTVIKSFDYFCLTKFWTGMQCFLTWVSGLFHRATECLCRRQAQWIFGAESLTYKFRHISWQTVQISTDCVQWTDLLETVTLDEH